ncbi:MAG: septum formation initiator family protein [Jatrophihabitantaceae bacterium]
MNRSTPPTGHVPRRAVTGRALVLGTLVVLLIVLLASPLNRYFNSRSDVSNAAQQLDQDRAKVTQLQAQLALWSDPGYLQQQARVRLQYAMPGDTVFVVVDNGAKSDLEKTRGTGSDQQAAGSWNEKLWTSIQKAGGGS